MPSMKKEQKKLEKLAKAKLKATITNGSTEATEAKVFVPVDINANKTEATAEIVKKKKKDKKNGTPVVTPVVEVAPVEEAPVPAETNLKKKKKKAKNEEEAVPAKKAKISVEPKAVKPKAVVKPKESSDDDSSDEDEVDAPAQVTPAVVAPAKEESDSESSDDSEEESVAAVPVAKATPVVAKKNGVVAPKAEESDSDSEESEDEAPAKVPAKTATPVAATQKKEESDSDSSDESEDEAPAPVTKAATPVAAVQKKAAEESSSEDSSEDEDEVDTAAPKVKAAPVVTPQEESSDEDDSDEEEKPKTKSVKPAAVAAAKEESDSEEESEDESEDEDDDESDDQQTHKRKGTELEAVTPKKQKTEEAVTLFIRNMPEDADEKSLIKLFSKVGVAVASARVIPNKSFGFVDLEAGADVTKALTLDETTYKGNEISVQISKMKTGGTPGTPGTPNSGASTSMFVKNLPYTCTEKMLTKQFPTATSVRMPTDPEGNIKGFAFVEFSTEAECRESIDNNQGIDIGGRSVYLDAAAPKTNASPGGRGGRGGRGGGRGGGPQNGHLSGKTKVLFVKGISYSSTDDSLMGAFAEAVSARIATDRESGESRGFGFVDFHSNEQAKKAFDTMNGQFVDGRSITLDFAEERGSSGGGGGDRGGRGGGRGGGGRGGRGGFGDRGRGGRGRGGRGGIQEYKGKKKSFNDDSD